MVVDARINWVFQQTLELTQSGVEKQNPLSEQRVSRLNLIADKRDMMRMSTGLTCQLVRARTAYEMKSRTWMKLDRKLEWKNNQVLSCPLFNCLEYVLIYSRWNPMWSSAVLAYLPQGLCMLSCCTAHQECKVLLLELLCPSQQLKLSLFMTKVILPTKLLFT